MTHGGCRARSRLGYRRAVRERTPGQTSANYFSSRGSQIAVYRRFPKRQRRIIAPAVGVNGGCKFRGGVGILNQNKTDGNYKENKKKETASFIFLKKFVMIIIDNE